MNQPVAAMYEGLSDKERLEVDRLDEILKTIHRIEPIVGTLSNLLKDCKQEVKTLRMSLPPSGDSPPP